MRSMRKEDEARKGYFGTFGGSYVPEQLQPRLDELDAAFVSAMEDDLFAKEFTRLLKEYVGRPSALTYCANISREYGGGRLFLKREDLNHTGAHKINNTIGQALLARRMGKKELIAETGAGMHGTATATVAALMGMKCTVYMGEVDVHRQAPNVSRMKALGAEVVSVTHGQKTLKEAVDAALEAYVLNPETFYLLGSAVGPHPFPTIVRQFQSVIGKEAREQFLEREGKLPDHVLACVGGGSNAIGIFSGFLDDRGVGIMGVEPAGRGLETNEHAATLVAGKPGIIHGFRTYVLTDNDGEPAPVYSISAGLDYPGVGPEHAFLMESGRASYVSVTDDEAVDAFRILCRLEGIIPALESSHAVAQALKILPELSGDKTVLVNLSGRGDKDLDSVLPLLGLQGEVS
ncbi:MAG TPA: tryptophan synthase subunit beta [Synergistales bacterium]|nr:tryptophan synthase subunit beta [Synergistales bacterium]MDD3134224.1 tryptophan synthase subunit beta [Synergistales bacterium]MDD3830012.1 tryptophan synthase subunit beta [Synergistales bacterium]MDD5514944.1 tryptophan synthase subunit beta [Synergistales bacterium]HOI82176.1 tryptophan synthase subunit beta [Synergistales bacterium]